MRGWAGLPTGSGAWRWELDKALGHCSFCRVEPRLPVTVRELQTIVSDISSLETSPIPAQKLNSLDH